MLIFAYVILKKQTTFFLYQTANDFKSSKQIKKSKKEKKKSLKSPIQTLAVQFGVAAPWNIISLSNISPTVAKNGLYQRTPSFNGSKSSIWGHQERQGAAAPWMIKKSFP